jgi:hypothetical protein
MCSKRGRRLSQSVRGSVPRTSTVNASVVRPSRWCGVHRLEVRDSRGRRRQRAPRPTARSRRAMLRLRRSDLRVVAARRRQTAPPPRATNANGSIAEDELLAWPSPVGHHGVARSRERLLSHRSKCDIPPSCSSLPGMGAGFLTLAVPGEAPTTPRDRWRPSLLRRSLRTVVRVMIRPCRHWSFEEVFAACSSRSWR